MCLTILLFFQEYCNFQNNVTKFLSNGAYTVYLIHPIIIVSLTHLYIYVEIETSITSNNDDPVVVGWLVISLLALSISWCVAYCLKQLFPGLKSIL